MTYLGESFSYTSGVGYLEGANIKFINKTNKIIHEPILAPDVVTEFYIYTGMKITDIYEFTDGNPKNEVGIYDMIISYKDEEIVVKDFLNELGYFVSLSGFNPKLDPYIDKLLKYDIHLHNV